MKKGPATYLFAFLLTAVVFLPGVGNSQIAIFHEAVPTFTEFPVNWQSNNGGGQAIFQPGTGGYLLVDHIDDWVVTESYDLSLFETVELTVDIASYGSGEDNSLTIEISIDNGLTWNFQTIETNSTINTTYITQGPYIIETNSSEVRFRFRRNASTGRGVHFREILLLGEFRSCGYESFSNLPTNSPTNYLSRTWVADDGTTWTANGVRTDETINGKAICWGPSGTRNLITPEYENGIGILKFNYVRAFTNTNNRRLAVYVNNLLLNEIIVNNTSDEVQNYIDTLNISGKVIIEIRSIGTGQVKIDDLTWTCYEKPSCLNTYQYYRTTGSGNWETKNIWEASANGIDNWIKTSCPPDYRAASITIRNSHFLVINEDFSIRNLNIEPGGSVEYRNGVLNIMGNGLQPGLNIEGRFVHNSNKFPRIFNSIEVKEGGEIRINRVVGGISIFYAGKESEGKVIWNNNSIFFWNIGTSFTTDNQEYFPGVSENVIPVFRVNTGPTVGAGSSTIFNGVFEANGNITFQNAGTKTFRNGIIGSGNVTQAANSGPFIINGHKAKLGGTGNLILNSNGLEISGEVDLISDKTISGGPVTISGEFNAGEYILSLGGDLIIEPDAVFNEGTSNLVLNGSSTQTLYLPPPNPHPVRFASITVNNPAGVSINQDIQVKNTLSMQAGNIFNEGQTITVGESVENVGNVFHDGGSIYGKLRRWIKNADNRDYLFPVGKPGFTTHAEIKFTNGPESGGSFTAEFVTPMPDDYFLVQPIEIPGDPPLIIDEVPDEGFWRIDAGNGLRNGTYTLSLAAEDIQEINVPEGIRILKRNYGDNASNYQVFGAWNDGSNQGSGFGDWDLWTDGNSEGFAGHFIFNSTEFGHGDINTDLSSFGMVGHSGKWAHAQRTISEWDTGYEFWFDMAVQYRDGAKGIVLYDATWNELWSFNISGGYSDGYYGTTQWPYYGDMIIHFLFLQKDGNIDIKLLGQSKVGNWTDEWSTTVPGVLKALRFYNGGSVSNDPEIYQRNHLYFNNLKIISPWAVEGTTTHLGSKRFSVSGLTNFSDFTLGGYHKDNPLPIELLSFTAKYQDGKVLLNWATGSEINNDYFTLERSSDAVNAEIIGFVEGAGNSSQTLHYEYIDHDPLPGISYYRLKQTDYDGSFEYSQWVVVQVQEARSTLSARVLRRPGGLVLQVHNPSGCPLKFELVDAFGKVIHNKSLPGENTEFFETVVSIPHTISQILFFRLSNDHELVTGKIIR